MIQGIDFVAYPVQDLPRAVAFYQELLGLKLLKHSEGKWAEFDLGEGALCLYPFQSMGATEFKPADSLALRVDDMAAWTGKLKAAGVPLPWGEAPHDSGFCLGLAFQDPEGNTLWVHHRYKSEAEVAGEADPQA